MTRTGSCARGCPRVAAGVVRQRRATPPGFQNPVLSIETSLTKKHTTTYKTECRDGRPVAGQSPGSLSEGSRLLGNGLEYHPGLLRYLDTAQHNAVRPPAGPSGGFYATCQRAAKVQRAFASITCQDYSKYRRTINR